MQQWVKNQIQKKTGVEAAFISPVLLVPKAAISIPIIIGIENKGRSSDLLHLSAAFPPFIRTVANWKQKGFLRS